MITKTTKANVNNYATGEFIGRATVSAEHEFCSDRDTGAVRAGNIMDDEECANFGISPELTVWLD